MPTLDARRTYSDGSILFAADLDAIVDDIETLLNVTKLNDDNIQDLGITASTKLIDASVTTGKLAASAIITSKIADANVTTVKIADANVTTAKIADASVTTAKIADANVTRAKIETTEQIPVGTVWNYAGSAAPTGWLICDGTSYSTTGTYATLYAAIGTTYGSGTGTFKVPDMRGRTPIGVGTGSGLTARTLGGQVGSETTTHTHSFAHTHDTGLGQAHRSASGSPGVDGVTADASSSSDYHIHSTVSQSTSTTGTPSNTSIMQPSLGLNFIIKY